MAYEKTIWVSGMPITQDKMMKIENELATLDTAISDTNRDIMTIIGTRPVDNNDTIFQNIISLSTALYGAQTSISGIVNDMNAAIYNHQQVDSDQNYDSLNSRFEYSEGYIKELRSAYEFTDALNYGSHVSGKNYSHLTDRFNDIETDVFNINSIIAGVTTYTDPNNNTTTYPGFANRLNSLETLIKTINQAYIDNNSNFQMAYNAIIEALSSTAYGKTGDNAYGSIDARFEAIEVEIKDGRGTSGSLINHFNTIETEINDAHQSDALNRTTANGNPFPSLDNRFETIEGMIVGTNGINSRLNTLTSNVESLTTGKIDVLSIENNLNTPNETSNHVLDARQGRILKETINTLTTNYQTADTNILDRIDLIDNASTGTVHGLDTRLTSVENEIGAAHRTGLVDVNENPITDSLDNRFDDIEARATELETKATAAINNINTIANELSMLDNGTIRDTNTKIDNLERDVQSFATELAMSRDANGALIDTNTRVDALASAISHNIDLANNDNGGLTERLTAAEKNIGSINNAISHVKDVNNENDKGGLTERLTAVETIAGNAATSTALNNLSATVTALDNALKASTTVIHEVTYDSETGAPTNIQNPSTDIDYLLKNGNKYYYWKYIKTSSSPDTYAWALISGAGDGEGNTSGFDMTAEAYEQLSDHDINTDYYVSDTDGVHHYRWIPGESDTLVEIEIGNIVDTNQIKKYNISRVTGKKREYNSETQTWTETDEDVEYLNLYQYDYDEDNTTIDTERPYFSQIELPKGGDGGSSSSQKNVLTRIGSEVIQKVTGSQILLRVFFSSYDATGTESNVGYATLRTGNSIIFSNRELSSYTESTVPSPLTWQANTAGFHEFDVTDYCSAGNTIFTLSVDVGGSAPIGKTWRVNLTELRLESDAPDNLLIAVDNEYAFPYTPIGAVNKTLTVTIDKNTINEQVRNISIPNTISGTPSTYVLDPTDLNLAHGKHTIELQLFAQIGGITEPSNTINREYIWYDATDTTTPIIIASQYEGITINTTQYSTIEIPYQVYKKNSNTINVEYYLDDEVTPYQTSTLTNVNTGVLTYIASNTGDHSLKIKVDDVYITINLVVASSSKNLSPISGIVIDFDPTTLSNSSTNRLPIWNTKINGVNQTFQLTASSNFNWSDDINGGGYRKDANGDKCFVIKAGSYVDLDYPMFANDVFGNGAEMKIIFKTSAVRNAEAVWYKNTGEISGKTVGIQLGAHSGWLKTDKAVATSTSADEDQDDNTITIKGITYTYWQPETAYNPNDVRIIQKTIYRCTKATNAVNYDLENADLDEDPYKTYMKNWAKVGQLDTEIIATNSYLYFPYSEEDKIELDININKSNTGNDFIMSYEDGVPSKAYAYTTGAGGDKIAHNNTIHIGSDECDVYIYHLRYYVKSLSTDQILQNFIADGRDLTEKVNRYDRNCIYWNPYLNDGNGGYTLTKTAQSSLDPIKLAEKMPDVKVLMLDTDIFTTSKKDFVMNSTLRCIHAEGGNVYRSRGDEDNWLFINGFHAGQGTTSDNYGQSARNVDFLFEVDARHWPSKEKNMGKYKISENPNYISTVIKGTEASEFTNNSWGTSYSPWAAETSYIIGNKIIINNGNKGTVYSCTKAHTSGETFNNDEAKNWNKIGTTSKCSDWMADDCKVTLTESSVPNNYFNFKANVASSENVNNALFQKRYDDFLTYNSPAQAAQVAKHHDTYDNIEDVKVKNCMEFVPAVLFVRERAVNAQTGLPEGHVEFNDCDWHFYALGNIGDSKKSDYTRAYDPDDMNEFTCENSDNNTNNGQFQSGVFTYQGHTNAIETDYPAWNETTAYETDDIVVYNGMVYTRTGANQTALGQNETYSWIAADWTAITYTGWTDDTPPYFAPRTNPNPMEYTYPISSSQWNVKLGNNYLNRKHMTLVKEKFDGDHSFEFRYACCGDYRDGDRINDTHGDSEIPVDPSDLTKGYKTNDDVQEALNHDVVLALYEWVVTANQSQYEAEASQWFVKNAMEFFYAYTHYYTMMDNRAKNTFWHFAKTGQHRRVSRPVPELFHVYEVADGTVTTNTEGISTGTFAPATGEFNPNGEYYTQYAFDLWVYDCDTAAGIDNNGALVFPYGKEDEDYRGDDASTGYAFNGAGSIFWRRLKTTFVDEIGTVMTQAGKNCFDPEHLIDEFDNFQSCFPEEIWRLDIQRKYIRTYTGESIDNSITTNKQNARFLMSMMQGRKKYQRRQWIRDQSFYFNSKYKIGEIEVNKTEFNIVSPAGDHSLLAVPPDYHLRLTPYQDMYLNVVVGNGSPIPQIRAKANTEYTIKLDDYTAGNFAETRVYISGFRMISKLGGLAPMYPYSFTLNGLEHLKELDIGTDTVGYTNGNFTELPLTDKVQLPLLEKLNIKNCSSLSTSIGLKTANNLRVVEAVGSSIGGISLPDYTQIEVLHLPTTVTDLILNNARFLRDFSITDITGVENYNNLYTLNIENSDYSGTYVWAENTDYQLGELLIIGNNVYRCKYDHKSVAASTQYNSEAWNTYLSTNWTLVKENSKLPIDWIDIALKLLQKRSIQSDVQLLGLYSATIGNISTLEPMDEIKQLIEEDGGIVELSGVINITGDWSAIERDYYGGHSDSVWPSLEFDTSAGTQQTKHKVTYCYDEYQDSNGDIVPSSVIKTIYVNDGATAPDIYSNGTLSEMPSREATVRNNYEFGTIDNLTETYIPYSGWKLSGTNVSLYSTGGAPIIRNDTVIETYFNTSPRTYYVKWYMNRNNPASLVKTSVAPVEYGSGYDLEAPTVAEIHNANQDTCSISISNGSATYAIFNGWEKLPTNINPTASDESYNIYANWNTGTVIIDDLFNINNLNNLTPEQLLVLSALDATGKNTYNINNKIAEGTRVTYTLGQDSIATGINLINGNPLRLDGAVNNSYATSIQPLKAGNDAFTLAIDYCFNPNVTYSSQYSFAVLASCYNGSISTDGIRNGFGLFYGTGGNISGPRVGFGDMYNNADKSVSVGNENTLGMRNIVVLRHPAGSNTLYVYSGLNNSNTLPSNVVVNTLTWDNYNSDAYLNFGQLTDATIDPQDGTPQIITNGQGTIFWAKYWNEDLGQGECKRIATWPHEQMTYAISRLSQTSTSPTRVSNTITVTPSIYLSALSTSEHGRVVQNVQKMQAEFSGKDKSLVRTICNNRIFAALPTQIQAIMCQPTIAYTVVNYTVDQQGIGRYQINNTAALAKDYVFQYSAANLINDSSSIYATREDTYSHPFAWYNSVNVEPYTYVSGQGWALNDSDGSAATYLNIRFPFKAISWGATNKLRVFRELTNEVPAGSLIAYTISSKTGTLKSGDIYIDTNNETYIYVLNSEILALGIQIMPDTGDNIKFGMSNGSTTVPSQYRGGWIKADSYWTRSAIAGSNGANFAYCEDYGTPNISAVSSASTFGLSLIYTIAI